MANLVNDLISAPKHCSLVNFLLPLCFRIMSSPRIPSNQKSSRIIPCTAIGYSGRPQARPEFPLPCPAHKAGDLTVTEQRGFGPNRPFIHSRQPFSVELINNLPSVLLHSVWPPSISIPCRPSAAMDLPIPIRQDLRLRSCTECRRRKQKVGDTFDQVILIVEVNYSSANLARIRTCLAPTALSATVRAFFHTVLNSPQELPRDLQQCKLPK